MMCGNEINDLFKPPVWAMSKANSFWKVVAAQSLTEHVRQMESFVVGAVAGQYWWTRSEVFIKAAYYTNSHAGAADIYKAKVTELHSELLKLGQDCLHESRMYYIYISNLLDKPGEIMGCHIYMEWKKIGYLNLIVTHEVEIDMTKYLTTELQAPTDAKQDHLIKVLHGWKDGSI